MPDDDRLFDMPPVLPSPNGNGRRNTKAPGTVAEYVLIAELLQRGHKVAAPVVDDDGVDLIVDYRTVVQVKSTNGRWRDNNRYSFQMGAKHAVVKAGMGRRSIAPHVHVLACYAADIKAWWHIPRTDVGDVAHIHLTPGGKRGRSMWYEAWHIYKRLP